MFGRHALIRFARFVTTARFVTKVTKRAVMPARFVTNEVVTNRAGIAPFLLFFSFPLFFLRLYVCPVCVFYHVLNIMLICL